MNFSKSPRLKQGRERQDLVIAHPDTSRTILRTVLVGQGNSDRIHTVASALQYPMIVIHMNVSTLWNLFFF